MYEGSDLESIPQPNPILRSHCNLGNAINKLFAFDLTADSLLSILASQP